jgi:hypothetical protein
VQEGSEIPFECCATGATVEQAIGRDRSLLTPATVAGGGTRPMWTGLGYTQSLATSSCHSCVYPAVPRQLQSSPCGTPAGLLTPACLRCLCCLLNPSPRPPPPLAPLTRQFPPPVSTWACRQSGPWQSPAGSAQPPVHGMNSSGGVERAAAGGLRSNSCTVPST